MEKKNKKTDKNEDVFPVRKNYEELGVEGYYLHHGDEYRNPHEPIIRKLIAVAKQRQYIGETVLDLCCGSGEVTVMLDDRDVTGVDPFTKQAYYRRTGKVPLTWTFQDICNGKLKGRFDTVVCSFALHLCPKSLLPVLLWQIGQMSNVLIVITPNKKPDCDGISNWVLVEEAMESRVRMMVYMR